MERIDWRKKIDALSPQKAREWQISEYQKCSQANIEGIVYWFNNYVWTINTKILPPNPSIIPFVLYPHQEERLIPQLMTYTDTYIEKSREMGISWAVMAWELWNVLYTTGFTALNISRKESEVQDSGCTYHSLHGRLQFMYQRLPPFLKPKVYSPYLTFGVAKTNSVIKGESSNPKAGRDTQYKVIFVDEAAHVDCLDEMFKGLRNATNCIILNSTPPSAQVNNKYAEIGEMKNSGFAKLRFHWKEHPLKTDEWFKKKTASMTEQEVGQELEIKYDAALTSRSYSEYKDEVHMLSHKVYINNKRPLYCFMDFGLAGEVFLWAQVDIWKRLFILRYDIFHNKLTRELLIEMKKCLADIGYTGEGKYIKFIGDKSGDKRSRTTKTSVISEYHTLSKGDVDIKYRELTNDEKMKCMKSCLKQFVDVNGVMKPQFNVSKESSCLKFAKCLKMLQLNKTKKDHLDNKYTHAVNACEYGINFLFPRRKVESAVVCLDSNQRFDKDENGQDIIVRSRAEKAASVSSVVSQYRINRKGVIIP